MADINIVVSPAPVYEVVVSPAPVYPVTVNSTRGADGADGVGVPDGGTTGQVLAKATGDDYDTEWVDQTGGGGGFPSPTVPDFTDVTNAAQDTLIESNEVTASGDSAIVWPAVVRGDGSPEVSVNSGSWLPFASFRTGDMVKLRLLSSANPLATRIATLYAQGVAIDWSVTTIEGSSFDALLANLQVGAAQLIAHPLDYGGMFQDRAGTVPVTASGQVVGQVLDVGGGNYHATAISDPARGIFRDVDGFKYIEYNGTNTAYKTAALPTPDVDKAQVFAGVQKLSSVAGILLELSATVNSNVGSFYVAAPESVTSLYSTLSRGNVGVTTALRADILEGPAPDTAVLTALHDIPADLSRIRRNGVVGVDGTGNKGSGDFNPAGAYPLFYGARNGTSIFFSGRSYATLGPIVRFSATNATSEQIDAAETYFTSVVV